jgi:hypothetical protein
MEKQIPNGLRSTFIVHAAVALVSGAALMFIPGRALTLLGWVPAMVQLPESELSVPGGTFVDPVLVRLLGATLLGLAYMSFRFWQIKACTWAQAMPVVQFETALCALSVIALLIGLYRMERGIPLVGWLILLLYAAFFVAWGLFLGQGRRATAG